LGKKFQNGVYLGPIEDF